MFEWVLLKKFCDATGFTPDAVYSKCNKGIWCENDVWRKGPDGHIYINVPRFHNWVAGNPPANQERMSQNAA